MAAQVQPPLLEKETAMPFVNTLKALFINHMLDSDIKSLSDIVIPGEMIGNVIKSEKIDIGENVKMSALKKENEVVYNMNYLEPAAIA